LESLCSPVYIYFFYVKHICMYICLISTLILRAYCLHGFRVTLKRETRLFYANRHQSVGLYIICEVRSEVSYITDINFRLRRVEVQRYIQWNSFITL
jgi:hypothetical protein